MAKYPIYEENEEDEYKSTNREDMLVSWVVDRCTPWADHRDTNYKDKWEEYYRIWRGIWASADKTRDSERSKLISPATSQAIEVATAEIEEAVFGSGKWFDVYDENGDPEPNDVMIFRDKMLEDLDKAGVPSSMAQIFLNGRIYGTGIGKIVVEVIERTSIAKAVSGALESEFTEVVQVKLIPVEPDEFIIDPSARSIEESLGVAHEVMVPRHLITEKQAQGIYRNVELQSFQDTLDLVKDEFKASNEGDEVKITEWHGLVPASYIDIELDEDEELEDLGIDYDHINEYDLIEAIVTIANDSVLLRGIENPNTMKDRGFLAYQHDTVPNQFWGRGITEKGYNSQKALDAELRGRLDAMALAIHPVMAMDATRVPRGADFRIKPGKTILTNGDPRTVLMPFNFGQVGTNTFQQSGELERMIQMATGTMDSAAPIGVSPRNSTLGGMSIMQAGSIKRSKRTLSNIENNFIKPFIEKAAWRYMQFDPERYPVRDYTFMVSSTMGIMARELEQQQLTALLSTVPPDSPAYWMLIRGIYDNSSIKDKEKMLALVDQLLEQSLQPKGPDPMEEAKLQYQQKLDGVKLQIENSRAQTEAQRVEIEKAKAMPIIQRTEEEAKFKQVERNLAIREQELKEREADIKEAKNLLDAELDRQKMVLDAEQKQAEKEAPKEEAKPPVININGSSKKKITVTRTSNGLEGEMEEVE